MRLEKNDLSYQYRASQALIAELEARLEYSFLPVRDLVAYQLAAGVAAADYVRDHHRPA